MEGIKRGGVIAETKMLIYSENQQRDMEFLNNFEGIREKYLGFQGVVRNNGSSLVVDNGIGELVKTVMKPGQKLVDAEKALIAIRNHSEAERRRRERINAHLATLRTLIPRTDKMDKAGLLGEVINEVKAVRQSADEASNGSLVPSDSDEVRVEEEEEDPSDAASICIRAWLCCDFKHELLRDLRQAVESLPHLKAVRAEISTLGTRMISVFVISAPKSLDGQSSVESIRQAFRSVLDKFYASQEFSSRNTSTKRPRVSFFAPSGLGDAWR